MAGGNGFLYFLVAMVVVAMAATSTSAALSTTFYSKVCPDALPTIKKDGCDGSVLLDSTSSIDGEKGAFGNVNSLRGFDVVDMIKSAVDKVCGPQVVSCSDILAAAARDSVVQLGGQTWTLELGRRDSTTASRTAANNALPNPAMNLPALKGSKPTSSK
ncbi:hypothetical protein MKX01_012432 [Papaver californicum]|nr:hypothetical protein MKX01_012432 [Papaver californicum]